MNTTTYTRLQNEGGDGYMPQECIAQSMAENHARKAAQLNNAGWTIDATAARRAEWNALIKSGAITAANGKADMRKVAATEKAQGWTMADLRSAVIFWGLK